MARTVDGMVVGLYRPKLFVHPSGLDRVSNWTWVTNLVETELLSPLAEHEEHGVNHVRLATAVRSVATEKDGKTCGTCCQAKRIAL